MNCEKNLICGFYDFKLRLYLQCLYNYLGFSGKIFEEIMPHNCKGCIIWQKIEGSTWNYFANTWISKIKTNLQLDVYWIKWNRWLTLLWED